MSLQVVAADKVDSGTPCCDISIGTQLLPSELVCLLRDKRHDSVWCHFLPFDNGLRYCALQQILQALLEDCMVLGS
eukprot:14068973-Ditylum_brightwellii.AAC.1